MHFSELCSLCKIKDNTRLKIKIVESVLRDCNDTRTHNHLVRKRTLNHLGKLTD